jgi:hypothetical protein
MPECATTVPVVLALLPTTDLCSMAKARAASGAAKFESRMPCKAALFHSLITLGEEVGLPAPNPGSARRLASTEQKKTLELLEMKAAHESAWNPNLSSKRTQKLPQKLLSRPDCDPTRLAIA